MADPSVGDMVLYSFSGQLLGQKTLTTFMFHLDTLNGTIPTLDTALSDLNSYLTGAYGLEAAFLACCPTNYFLDRRWAQRIFPTRDRRREYGTSVVGTGLAGSETANVACSIERFSDKSGRWAQGRINPPIPASTLSMLGGSLTAAQATRCDNLAAKLYGQLTLPVTGVKWSHCLYDSAAHTGSIFLPLVGAKTQLSVRVMRRRTVGVGK